jgi:LacI family transcriptional regulator
MALASTDTPGHVTIRDIARAAGVSVTAVSRALNNKAEISQEKRELILDAARKLRYTPSAVARALVSGSTRTLGVVVTDNTSPVYAQLLRGIEEVANDAGFGLLFANSADSQDKALRCLAMLQGKQVDGLLWTPVQTDRRDIELLQQSGIPFVLLLRHFADLETDYVIVDNVRGGYLVTEHLLELGHRAIGHVAGPQHTSSGQGRLAGYRRALKKWSVAFDAALVSAAPFTIAGGHEAAGRLLDCPRRPSAIVAATDLQAVGVLQACRERGLRVPDDLALTGGDDIDLADYLEVPLTSFASSVRDIGARGAEIIIARLQGQPPAERQVVFKPKLIIRRSSACPQRSTRSSSKSSAMR